MDDLYIKYMDETYGLSGGGSSVSITPSLSSGTKVADYEIDGVTDALYAPTPTEIEANPSDTATTDLEKIDIGGVVYGIPTGVDDIADLSDVDISSPTDGQILKYNITTSKWENAAESGGTNPTGTAVADLNSVQIGNDIYSIPSGGGGGGSNDGYYKETEIYSSTSSSASITLNNSYLDYDALIFLNKYNSGGYILDSIVSTTGITEAADNNCQFRIHCGSDSAYIFGTVTNDTQFALTMRNYFVTKVIGVNYTKNRTKALIPKMTSATTPSGTVTASYNNSTMYPYMAFDGANGGLNTLTNTWLPTSGETTSWIMYEFDELKQFESLKTRTGGSAASNNVVFDVEGRKADGTWENCLASGTDVTLSFPVYSYTYTDTPLNGKEYNAIRLTSHSTMFVTNQYGCGIDVIQVYGKNVSS